jgi:ParB-like chromosome segregation protein Spo0J
MTKQPPRNRSADAASIAIDPKRYETRVVPREKVKRYFNNPRKHEKGIQTLASIIQAFGFRQPLLVDKDLILIKGEGRLLAAELLQLPAVPVWIAEDLTPAQVKALRIADNKVHEESEWDHGKLGVELESLLAENFDMSLTGFDRSELDRVLAKDEGDAMLEPIEIRPAPTHAWVLVGIDVNRYAEIAEEVEKISRLDGVFCEVVANNTDPAKPIDG